MDNRWITAKDYGLILPNGRADQEGVRIGDIVETINGKHCTSYKMFNAKVRGARDVLRLRFISFSKSGSSVNEKGSMLTKCKHLKHLPPAPVKPALQGRAAIFNCRSSNSSGA
ncbi:hypothetical protein WUBG_03256 [Wuchereria bancrofti]|uniref:PDZ domain-containing protein n=1 Tax=Wuchereria bancrofti TaxID=6293 RepID=J9BF07_WUCBA|nr:hypothetical protein WUBG_03256 [Wuchereria bancrofti]